MSTRFTQVIHAAGEALDLALDGPGTLYEVDADSTCTIPAGLPLGFNFGVRINDPGSGFVITLSGAEVVSDESDSEWTNIAAEGLNKGEMLELVKVTSTKWFTVEKRGNWSQS